jgi:RNA ligase
MSIFPVINHLDDLLPVISHLPEIRVAVQDNGFTVVCYMIADKDTFSGSHDMWARECRGITFDREGNIASRSMHKFFNVNERESTLAHKIKWAAFCRKMDKRDGSVINSVIVDGYVQFKSKKSFTSDVAKLATKIATSNHIALCQQLHKLGFSPAFEITSPDALIVLRNKVSELTLLHIRANVSGKYLSSSEVTGFALEYGVPVVLDYCFTDWASDQEYLQNVEGMEGFVYQFLNGDMVKAKSTWYLERHACITNLTQRAVAEAFINEATDDMKSYLIELNEPELFAKIEQIENDIVDEIDALITCVTNILNLDKHLDRKEFAIKYKSHQLFGLLMAAYLDKEPNYKDYYSKYILKTKFDLITL